MKLTDPSAVPLTLAVSVPPSPVNENESIAVDSILPLLTRLTESPADKVDPVVLSEKSKASFGDSPTLGISVRVFESNPSGVDGESS